MRKKLSMGVLGLCLLLSLNVKAQIFDDTDFIHAQTILRLSKVIKGADKYKISSENIHEAMIKNNMSLVFSIENQEEQLSINAIYDYYAGSELPKYSYTAYERMVDLVLKEKEEDLRSHARKLAIDNSGYAAICSPFTLILPFSIDFNKDDLIVLEKAERVFELENIDEASGAEYGRFYLSGANCTLKKIR